MVTGSLQPGRVRERIDAVVVGASAGAIEALNVLLPALPRTLSAAVVVLVHLSPNHPSLMVELFAPKCSAPVREAFDKQPVDSGTIWFAPPNYHLLIEREHTFALSIGEAVHFSRPSIDVLFESAAYAYGSHLLGMVLTSASGDGCTGARTIQQRGGLLAVQNPDTAEAPYLPRSVLAQLTPDWTGDVSELSSLLVQLVGGTTP